LALQPALPQLRATVIARRFQTTVDDEQAAASEILWQKNNGFSVLFVRFIASLFFSFRIHHLHLHSKTAGGSLAAFFFP